jgi:protein-disulfide isomerase
MAQESVLPTGVDEPKEHRGRSGWIAPAWFFFGIIVGIAAFAAYTTFLAPKPATPVAAIDATQLREAARAGVLEAIATLQAGGGQPAAQEQGPQQVSPDAIAVRAANRLGEQAAKVTVVEFSDFQ